MKFSSVVGALLVCSCALPGETAAEKPPKGMVLIPAGSFTMGRTRETPDDKTNMRPMILRDDRPAHKVTLDAFYMDAHEVTQAEYAAFVKATGHRTPYHWLGGKMPAGQEKFPIHNVDWSDATAYCKWAGKRLPTEAEWERAARGGLEGQDYPWGDKIAPTDARFNTAEGPGPVGQHKPNSFGLFDMAGGISEWCSDWFERTWYEKSPGQNPTGPEAGAHKIIRGGAWSDGPRRVTVFFRNWVKPDQTTPNIGFRCVQSAVTK